MLNHRKCNTKNLSVANIGKLAAINNAFYKGCFIEFVSGKLRIVR